MGKRGFAVIAGGILTAVVVIAGFPDMAANAQMNHGDHGQMGHMALPNRPEVAPPSLEKVHSKQLPMLSISIEKALMAVEQGDKKAALAELNKAKTMLAELDLEVGKLVKPAFANALCPIMGSPITPDKVSSDLIRDYKGQKVAFCCAGCPAKWDGLTDTQKAARLAEAQAAKTKSQPATQAPASSTAQKVYTCPMHPQVKASKPGVCPICKMRLTAARNR